MVSARISLPMDRIADFCRRWSITELALFGSVLRDDFRPDSDVDILLSFAPETRWSFADLEDMEMELTAIAGRKIDLIERAAIEQSPDYIRRRNILTTAEPIYGG